MLEHEELIALAIQLLMLPDDEFRQTYRELPFTVRLQLHKAMSEIDA